MGPAVEVAGLTKAYGGRTVVRDLSFRIARGRGVRPARAERRRQDDDGRDRRGLPPGRPRDGPRARRGPGEGRARPPGAGRADAPGRGRDRAADDRAGGASGSTPGSTPRRATRTSSSRMVGLSEAAARTRFRRLSGGERQRLSLALALVGRPAVAILDEPTAGMDVEARAATRELLARPPRRGHGGPPDEPRPRRRRARRRPDRDHRSRPARRAGRAGRAGGGSVPVLRFRLATPLADAGPVRPRGSGSRRGPGSARRSRTTAAPAATASPGSRRRPRRSPPWLPGARHGAPSSWSCGPAAGASRSATSS